MYQALYRKWRPRTFDDVVGQGHITETLKRQVMSGAVSHAYLFIGTRGTGKTSCAKILARAVNCEHPVDGNPCNQCRACQGIEDGSILDVEELDAASNNGVDNVRALRDEAVFSPVSVKKRVYIVDEVHMLSISAFNALLKILEEPPEHLMFILATTELYKVPATILSRCQRHSFKRLDPETVAAQLQYVAAQEQLELTPGAAAALGRLAEGSMRDGLSLLDQCAGRGKIDEALVRSAMGLAGGARTAELLSAAAAGDTAGALALFDALWRDGKDPATLLEELCALERDALITAVAPRGGNALVSGIYDGETLARFRSTLGAARLMSDIEKLQQALGELRNVPNPRTAAELCLISMCEPAVGGGLRELRARVERLEQGRPAAPAPAPVPPAPAAPPADPAPQPTAPPAPADDLPPWEDPEERPPLPEPPPPDPDPDPAPREASGPAPASEEADLWPRVLEKLRSMLPIGTYSMISDSASVDGGLEDGVLVMKLKTGFARIMLDKPEILDKLRQAAEAATGRALPVRAAEFKPPAPAGDKLSSLEKFGVKFE